MCSLAAVQIAQALFGDEAYARAVRAGGCAIALNGVLYLLQNQFRWELRPRAYAVVGVSLRVSQPCVCGLFRLGP